MIRLISILMFFFLATPQAPTPERKAVAYLVSEVPRWPAENRCFSCHNNGDGTRALIEAYRMKYDVSAQSIAGTTEWLAKPEEWGRSGQTGMGDEKLARIQFGAALADAYGAGLVKDRELVRRAAAQLLPHQEANGSWQVDAQASSPSAVTYGPVLATFMARRTLDTADDARFAAAIARADQWLRSADVTATVNAAAVVLAFAGRKDAAFASKREEARGLLLAAQNGDGGWGSFAKSPSEPFETSMALLALNAERDSAGAQSRIVRARAFLVSIQFEDGGWPASRQPGAGDTYARHLSTSAWATKALLVSGDISGN